MTATPGAFQVAQVGEASLERPSAPQNTLIVKCAGFGSVWWQRPGATLAHRAVMNTTGFVKGAEEVRCWCKPKLKYGGVVRINCNRSKPITRYEDLIGEVYQSPGVVRVGIENRLLLHPKVSSHLPIDCYLVQLISGIHGWVNLASRPFSEQVQFVSASKRYGQQEVLVLMWPGSTVTTTLGKLEVPWILKRQKLPNR